ncbi:MAG: hypothetical protein ACETVR_00395 [Candidatus Bathyarchaeia archaeon]
MARGRRISAEERIKELEENRESYIRRKVEAFEKRIRATYQAKIDLLREKGLPETRTQRRRAKRSIVEMLNRAGDRSIFYRLRYYEYMGLSPEEARKNAERDHKRYCMGWSRPVTG